MPKTRKLKGSSYEFYLDDRQFYYLKLYDGEEFTVENLDEIRTFIKSDYSEQELPFLIELAYGTTVDDEVQKHLATASNRYSKADAILISTFAHKLLTKFYKRHYKPSKPTKVFQDVFDALDWIATQNRAATS
jgi:hypothetical protein